MTNEEAIEILRGAIKKPNTNDGYLGQALDMAIKALEQVRWIPCSERLPKGKQPILISLTWDNDFHEVRQGNIDDINYWKHYDHITFIAWMPLPEPYVPDINDGKSDFNQASIKHKASFNQAEEVLDKIRAEIEELNPVDYGSMFSYESHNGAKYMKDEVLQIIDRYRKEEKDAYTEN